MQLGFSILGWCVAGLGDISAVRAAPCFPKDGRESSWPLGGVLKGRLLQVQQRLATSAVADVEAKSARGIQELPNPLADVTQLPLSAANDQVGVQCWPLLARSTPPYLLCISRLRIRALCILRCIVRVFEEALKGEFVNLMPRLLGFAVLLLQVNVLCIADVTPQKFMSGFAWSIGSVALLEICIIVHTISIMSASSST